MRNFNIIILSALFTLVSLNSCTKKLETIPTDFLAPENYFENKTQLKAGLTGVYNQLKAPQLYFGNYQFLYEGTDESVTNKELTKNTVPGAYSANSTSPYITGLWATLYTGINRANLVLENIDKPKDLTSDERNNIKGETKFLRAYYYFMLTQWFGDIPLRLSSTKAPKSNYVFTSSREIYDFVISEMTEAEQLLQTQKANMFQYSERVTQTVVQGMLARVCLYAAGYPINDNKRYNDALIWAKKVKASGLHQLNPDFQQVFINHSADLYDNTYRESMWEVGGTFIPTMVSLEEGTGSNIEQLNGINPLGLGSGSLRTSAGFYYNYESGDLRRDWTSVPYRYSGGSATVDPIATYHINSAEKWGRESGKWRRKYEVQLPRASYYTPKNVPLLRYSDVLLMLAEAENEVNGPTQIAIDAINEVRKRGYGELKGSRGVGSIEIENGGTGYASAPTITFTGGTQVVRPNGPYGALPNETIRATATVSAGKITKVDMVTMGDGYTSLPTVVLSGTNQTAVLKAQFAVSSALRADQTASPDAFRQAIRDERMRELAFEMLRRQDLKRWNILIETVRKTADEALNGSSVLLEDGTQLFGRCTNEITASWFTIPGAAVSNRDYLIPIPSAELSYNSLGKQNLGF